MLTPKRSSLVGMKAEHVDEESLLNHVELSGIQKWYKEDQEAARLLIKELCMFLKNGLDLGRITVVKHKINLCNHNPFQKCNRHTSRNVWQGKGKSTRDVGHRGIRPSHSLLVSTVVPVRKRDEKLYFCIENQTSWQG